MFLTFNKETKVFDISFDLEHWLESFVITQVFTDKKTPEMPSGWWAEDLEGFQVGSELWKLKRTKMTQENIQLALQSVANAFEYVKEQEAVSDFHILSETHRSDLILKIGMTPIEEPKSVEYVFRFALN